MTQAVRLVLPVISALLFQLSFPPVNLGGLALTCLVPWFVHLRSVSLKGAFWSGYLMGFLIVGGQMSFIHPLVTRWTGSEALSLAPWFVCCFLGAFYFAFAGVLIRSAFLRRWYWAVPLIWAGIEVGRSFIPGLAFPWFFLATPLSPYPAIDQLAFFGSIYLVSGWVCLVNLCLALPFLESRRPSLEAQNSRLRTALRYPVTAIALAILSIAWYYRPISGREQTFLVGQPGFDLAFGIPSERNSELRRRVAVLYAQARSVHASLLVLPEGVVEGGTFPPEAPFELEPEPPILFGGQRANGDPSKRAFQTAFLYDHGKWSYADKTRLVVFGEYVPGRDYLPFLKSFRIPSGDLKAAEDVSSLKLGSTVIGPMLCFEGLFYDVAHKQSENGAQVIAIMSIDDWYMGTAAPAQLRDGAIWRAIETGLPVLRSASTGYSLAVDQRGREIGSVPIQSLQGLPATVTIEEHPLRNKLRPLFPWVSGAFPFGFLAFCCSRRRRKNSDSGM